MKCPNCNETLLMTQRNQIEIDYCPSCRGVWLDKRELDKMLDFAAQYQTYEINEPRYESHSGFFDRKQNDSYGYRRNPKKKSFLGDLFDFD